jgi:MFS family permease
MGYVVGSALSTGLVAKSQQRFGRKGSFQLGLLVALLSAGLGAWAVLIQSFWLLVATTFIAGYYSANAQLYRFAAAELTTVDFREKAVSLVMAGGLSGAIIGPNLAMYTKNLLAFPFAGAYVALALVAVVSMGVMACIQFPPAPVASSSDQPGRPLGVIMRQPVFMVAVLCASLGWRDELAHGRHAFGHASVWFGIFRHRMGVAVARDWHVRTRLCDGPFDQTLWGAARDGCGRVAELGLHCGGLVGRRLAAVLGGLVLVGRGLELLVHRQHHLVDAGLHTAGEKPCPSCHQLLCVCHHGRDLVCVRCLGHHPRLGLAQLGVLAACGLGRRGADVVAVVRALEVQTCISLM